MLRMFIVGAAVQRPCKGGYRALLALESGALALLDLPNVTFAASTRAP